jgi:hypothetical protein
MWACGRQDIRDLSGLVHHSDAGSPNTPPLPLPNAWPRPASRPASAPWAMRWTTPYRNRNRPVQNRAHPPPRPLAQPRRRRTRHPGRGRLAQPPTPAHRLPRPHTRGIRTDPLRSTPSTHQGWSLNNLSLRNCRGGSDPTSDASTPERSQRCGFRVGLIRPRNLGVLRWPCTLGVGASGAGRPNPLPCGARPTRGVHPHARYVSTQPVTAYPYPPRPGSRQKAPSC